MFQCVKENTKYVLLDAEAVAIDRTIGQADAIQELSKRKRKDVKVKTSKYAFASSRLTCFTSTGR